MTTEMMQRHMAKVEAAENAEAEVYKAGIAWAPLQRTANDAMAQLRITERAIQVAQSEINRHLHEITVSDVEFGNDLSRLHNAGKLSRESIGAGGGKRIKDLLAAVTKLERATKEAGEARQRATDANSKANIEFRAVLLALDALKPHATGDTLGSINRVFTDSRKEPERVEDSCKTRLESLKA